MSAGDNSRSGDSDKANVALLKFIAIGTIPALALAWLWRLSQWLRDGVRLLSSYRESRLFDLFQSEDFPIR